MDNLAHERGYVGLFDDETTRKLKKTRAFCAKYKNRQLPTIKSTDLQEVKDARWLQGQRQAKKGKGSHTFYVGMDDIAREFGMLSLFDSPTLSKECAARWVKQHYIDHGEYPTQRSGAIRYAREDGFDRMTWATVFGKFAKSELVDSVRPKLTPELVRSWDEKERSGGRRALSKTHTSIILAAHRDGYPISASALNARLVKEFDITLAELLRAPKPEQEPFTRELARHIVLDEFRRTGAIPCVTTKCIRSAKLYGYDRLSGNALNKRLRRLGTTLSKLKREIKHQS